MPKSNPDVDSLRLRTLVVDDEPIARRNLTILLRRDPDIVLIEECDSGMEALDRIRRAPPDIVFLDVQMPECDGFDVLERLGTEHSAAIVFVTAHDQHALRAFEAGALDYLVKPFTDARFQLALRRAKQRLGHVQPPLSRAAQAIIVKSQGQLVIVRPDEIDWIEAADYYACLHVGSETHILRRSLAVLEQELPAESFCRIHRSLIVNLNRIQRLELLHDGEYAVVLKSGTHLRLSRRFRKRLQQHLGLPSE